MCFFGFAGRNLGPASWSGLLNKSMFSVSFLLEFSERIHELFLKYLQGYRDGSKGGIRWFISPLQVG